MSNPVIQGGRESALPAWLILPAAIGLLAGGGLAVTWANRQAPAPEAMEAPVPGARPQKFLPAPPDPTGMYSVANDVEHGVRVVKIRVSADGDELVVDAETGRLIEARPPRPAAAPMTPTLLAP
ncbi:MAG TPA: hypothetical protein VKD90_18105 [Gemmataceae bacterium]|nr:hypothetical protein [Gemmataceae bacterium]